MDGRRQGLLLGLVRLHVVDGTSESGSVPWPIHFSPERDPFTHPEIGALHNTPLPPPPPGYVPPPDLGKALRSFFPGYAFNNNG